MTPATVGPLSRPFDVRHLPAEGLDAVVEANADERAALARDFKLPAIHALQGRFTLTGSPSRVKVRGRVEARIAQVCVVTLDPFDSTLAEEVEVEFAPAHDEFAPAGAHAFAADQPDPILDGRIDLGSLTAEFLALGLDPYPKKPDARFEHQEDGPEPSPFAALGKLMPRE